MDDDPLDFFFSRTAPGGTPRRSSRKKKIQVAGGRRSRPRFAKRKFVTEMHGGKLKKKKNSNSYHHTIYNITYNNIICYVISYGDIKKNQANTRDATPAHATCTHRVRVPSVPAEDRRHAYATSTSRGASAVTRVRPSAARRVGGDGPGAVFLRARPPPPTARRRRPTPVGLVLGVLSNRQDEPPRQRAVLTDRSVVTALPSTTPRPVLKSSADDSETPHRLPRDHRVHR